VERITVLLGFVARDLRRLDERRGAYGGPGPSNIACPRTSGRAGGAIELGELVQLDGSEQLVRGPRSHARCWVLG